jgi:hypothetical protein
MTQTFSPKDPEEVVVLSVDFVNLLDSGEGITTATVVVEDPAGQPQAAMVSGAADTTAAPVVRQKVQGGTDGTRYLVRFKATTDGGRTLVGSGILPVQRGA